MISKSGNHTSRTLSGRNSAARHWTIADLLAWTEERFKKLGFTTPRLDAELLLARAMGCTRLELYTGYHKVVDTEERARFRSLVERRSRCEPVGYILGYREFHSLRFEVTPRVLIPRPETEHLIDKVLEELKKSSQDHPWKILDLGTGCGNIAVTLAVRLPDSRITAVDISQDALEVARRNASLHGVEDRIRFLAGDLFEPLVRESRPLEESSPGETSGTGRWFDAVVSNPPYVARSEYPKLMRDVRDYEPSVALIDERSGTGLGFYKDIVKEAPRYLSPGGLLAFEVGSDQSQTVESLLKDTGWREVRITSDMAGIPRVVTARATDEMSPE